MKKNNKANPRIGSGFDSWLKEDGIYEDVTAAAVKRVPARQIADEMAALEISKTKWRAE